jgi:poly(ADP-ribose) glycohydrolase ARH3
MANQVDLRSNFLGGMIGSALGDAIGQLAFADPDEVQLRGTVAKTDTLVYTDDTAMAIGLAESITQIGHLDPQHLGDTFRANYKREPWRGYALGPLTIFAHVERYGLSYTEVASSLFGGQGSYGNGAAMRIAPVGLFFFNSPDLYEQTCASAIITHTHPIGQDGAAILARAVAEAVKLDSTAPFPCESFCQELIAFARTPEIKHKMKLVKTLVAEDVSPPEAADQLGRSVAMSESMPFAVYAFVRHPHSFAECLFCATLNGGDRDTLGAMACAVSGAYLGIEAIPATWQDKLENRGYIEELALKLAQMAAPRG